MRRTAVLGGGIAGLTAAYRLMRLGEDPVLFEAQPRVGGVIRSEQENGFLIEHGPNSVQSTNTRLEELIADLSLENERIHASDAARTRYIVRNGSPVPAPTSPPALLASPLFSAAAKLRLLGEPFVRRGDPADDESVAAFVRRRLGTEILDYGVDPFVAGVYAGDPERLSMRHAFPTIYDMEQASGSLLKAQFGRRRGSREPGTRRSMFSFREGLETLPKAMAEFLGERIRTASPVATIEREGDRWTLHVPRASPDRFDAVVSTLPLHSLAAVDLPEGPDLRPIVDVQYAPLRIVALGFRREHVGHPLDGFGMLIPRVEGDVGILGTLFTSAFFPGRSPEGHVLLTTFLGGLRRPRLAEASAADVLETTLRDLRRLLDISGDAVLVKHVVWPRSIPQYQQGYGRVLDCIEAVERTWPGWFMAGNYRGGVSVGATIEEADRAARRAAAFNADPTRAV